MARRRKSVTEYGTGLEGGFIFFDASTGPQAVSMSQGNVELSYPSAAYFS